MFQWCTDVHFPSQPQAPQARAVFSTRVLFRSTPPSAAEVHRGGVLRNNPRGGNAARAWGACSCEGKCTSVHH